MNIVQRYNELDGKVKDSIKELIKSGDIKFELSQLGGNDIMLAVLIDNEIVQRNILPFGVRYN